MPTPCFSPSTPLLSRFSTSYCVVTILIVTALLTSILLSLQPLAIQAESTPYVVTKIALDRQPLEIAINEKTNTIYALLTWEGTQPNQELAIINGTTNTVQTVDLGNYGYDDVVVNPNTGKLYLTNGFDFISIRNANGIELTSFNLRVQTGGANYLLINSETNRIYVVTDDSRIAVIDGASDTFATISDYAGDHAYLAAINPRTNKLYVSVQDDVQRDDIRVFDIAPLVPQQGKFIELHANSDWRGAVDQSTNTIEIIKIGVHYECYRCRYLEKDSDAPL